jgi:membrane-associated protease RseP (regulator of RpoE activity)
VRALVGLAVVLAAAPVAAKSSNPAFLGVGMQDLGGARGAGPCVIDTVTPGGSASAAGLRAGDVFVAIDGTNIPSCDVLITIIQSREPGQQVKIDVRRNGGLISVKAELLSRAELLRRRFVSQILPAANLVRFDDRSATELDARGKTTVVGWFEPRCVGCASTFSSIDRWARKRGKSVRVFAATRTPLTDNLDELKPIANALDVPLLVADTETYQTFSISDVDRVHFMVIDCRGIVSYVAPIAPDADDLDAALDELYAAAEQAMRRMKM